MSDTTLDRPQTLGSADGSSTPSSDSPGPRSLVARHVWWLVALGVIAVSGVLILLTGTRPGYDPYGWMDWGYQTLRGTLDLGGAPSWKPFTYLFNVPFALFGHYALWLWMLTSVSVALAGAVFGGRIAYRLTAAGERHRYAAIGAAVFAGAAVLGIDQYSHYVLSVQSDPMLVAVCLAAIDCHLNGRRRWAWWLGALAALGRPEVWPFVGLYAIWLWLKVPSMRWMLYAAVLVIAFMWFGIPTITNHRPNIAGQLALKSPRKCTSSKISCTGDRFLALDYLPIQLAALLAVVLAALRRNRVVLALGGAVVLWVVVEIAFALHGFPGVPRYLFEPAALTGVLAGIMFGWLLLDVSEVHPRLPPWSGIPLAVILVAAMVPDAISQARFEHKDLFHEQARTTEINRLAATLNVLGGYKKVLSCGRPVVNVEYVSIMAWFTHRNTGTIGYRPVIERFHRRYPIVRFTPVPSGWKVQPYRTPASLRSTCAPMKAVFASTPQHSQGVLIRR